MEILWIVEKRPDKKFPYRLTIRQDNEDILVLLVQDRWPGQRGNIFCIRETQKDENAKLEEVERVNIISIRRYGKRISVVLDRAKEKRCDFIFLKKKYKNKEGEYEQIFWRTQKAISENRPKVKLSTYYSGKLNIIIDSGERYPWKFPNCYVERDKLPAGDYALKGENGLIAVVERKSFENIIAELGKMPAFHQQLGELSLYKYSALVIEANYSDFFKPEKLKFYSPTFTSKAIAELCAYHPKLQITFSGNRKLANEWTYKFFQAVAANEQDKIPQISEVIARYEYKMKRIDFFALKEKVKNEMPQEFNLKELKEKFPDIGSKVLRKIIYAFKKNKLIESVGYGRYRKINQTSTQSENK